MGMGQEQVPFPQDCPNWALVRDLLTELQERLLNETINAQDAALHVQVVYEACQAPQALDERWIQRQHGLSSQVRQGARQKLDQSYLWFGMLKFLKKVDKEEHEKFLFTTLPNIIELVLRVEENMPSVPLCFSQQQRGGSTVLSRQLIASILACSFLCLFPERVRDRASKLNVVNFTTFFKQLPQLSQMAKLRCVLHYFERTVESGLQHQGSVTFSRQVVDRNVLPTLDELCRSQTALCPLLVHTHGVIEDVGASAMQVDFANRAIGGGVLGRGRVQEEIRFSTCPELMAAMLFMEKMEDNEAIIIQGFEQFSTCTGYAASLEFAGPFYDKAKRDSSGNLMNTLCAIDATSFRWGGWHRQYQDVLLLREINKALTGFSYVDHHHQHRTMRFGSMGRGESSELEDEFVTASESLDEECEDSTPSPAVDQMAEVLAKCLLSQGMVEAVRAPREGGMARLPLSVGGVEPLVLDDMALLSAASDQVVVGQSSSTPREDEGQGAQMGRDAGGHGHGGGGGGGNGERLSLPFVMPRPQNGSSEILEVDYSEWLANFRRRSSQLSDVTSRRSSSSTKHSSEFSSDLEEIYETLVQTEKSQHGVIEEESYGAALSEYAAHFVTSLMSEGTSVAAQMLPGLKEFQQGKPPSGTVRPQVVRPMAVCAGGDNLSSDVRRPEPYGDGSGGSDYDDDDGSMEQVSGQDKGKVPQVPHAVLTYVDSLVTAGLDSGKAEAVSHIHTAGDEASDDDNHIPDDVYRWFADKIVQEVFAHVVDELYFQRFTSDSRWRAELPVNREGVQQRHDLSDSDSISSSSSSNDIRHGSSDFTASAHRSGADSHGEVAQHQEAAGVQRNRAGTSDSVSSEGSPSSHRLKIGSQPRVGSSSLESADQKVARRKSHLRRTRSQSSDSESIESRERKEERKSVTFTVDRDRHRTWSEGRVGGVSDASRHVPKVGALTAAQMALSGARSAESASSQWFVVKDVPVPFTKITTRSLTTSKATTEVSSSRSGLSGSKSAGGDLATSDTPSGAVPSSSFITSATSSIPVSLCTAPLTPSQSPSMVSAPSPAFTRLCDSSHQSADSRHLPSTPPTPTAGPALPTPPGHQGRGENPVFVPSSSSAFQSTQNAGKSQAASGSSPLCQATSDVKATPEESAASNLSVQDLNLDCYRAAAAIVNQVFQSLPDHLTEAELQSLRGSPTSFYYQGRKYESVFPRGSYETAAAVIGASEKGNVVSESYMVTKVVTGVTTTETSSPRRTRSQSPCFSWLSKRLSRETLTNAFVKVESRPSVKSYERRSSEPCQRSVTLSLQAFSTSRYGYMIDQADDQRRKNACTDDDLDRVKANSWRRGSLDSISLSRRRSSCGFKDPVLSRFAQELITADTSVPQLFLVGSGSTSSTTGSRRSSMSGFRDNTLATFESELLNSSFTLSQSATSPRHQHPQRSHSRESRLPKSDSSEAENWFPIPRRVGLEFQEQMERVHRHYSVDDVEDYADYVATTILQQAVSILYHDAVEVTQQDADISIFSENLADQVLREALITSASMSAQTPADSKPGRQRRGKPKSVSDSELEFSVSSNDLTGRSLEDRLTDFQDALDVSYSSLEGFAASLADAILTGALEECEGPSSQQLVPGGRAVATGNWGCGAFCGDPCLKVVLQWVAASVAQCPRLLYFTFQDRRLDQLPVVVDMLSRQRWTVGQLMNAVKAYCTVLQDEMDEGGDGGDSGGGRDRGQGHAPALTLLDFLLSQP
ncbi:uncharacterized protein LOC143289235 isoform X2 [Babylonia areolata]|uniref:uncharacterized protein LOC143289235 isoform X2 n=1 Tax=Babylonia areolata TaxID=304850 RepID=UPI003FD08B7B